MGDGREERFEVLGDGGAKGVRGKVKGRQVWGRGEGRWKVGAGGGVHQLCLAEGGWMEEGVVKRERDSLLGDHCAHWDEVG